MPADTTSDHEQRHPMTTPDTDDLADALITHARGLTAAAAAAELICAHRAWLTSTDFVDSYITTGTHASGQRYAYIHWDEAIAALDDHRIGGSGSATSILRIAASLADCHIPVHLACCLGNLDHVNIRLVATAITAANGRHVARPLRQGPSPRTAGGPADRIGGALPTPGPGHPHPAGNLDPK